MPTKSSNQYSITFRPDPTEEWGKYRETFLTRFQEKYSKSQYIIGQEKGSSKYINHYQISVVMEKEVRADSYRRTFNKWITYDMEFKHPKVAIKIVPVTARHAYQKGYCIKESPTLDNVISNLKEDELLEYYQIWKTEDSQKKVKCDKYRVNRRNIHVLFETYYKSKNQNWCLLLSHVV